MGRILQIATSNTFLSTIFEDDKRGRLISLYTVSFLGMISVGNLFGGFLASHIGATNTLIIDGIIFILGSIVFSRKLPALKKIMRPIYEQKGIVISNKA